MFPHGDNLPNEADLDGDLYHCVWDKNLIASMMPKANDEYILKVLSDNIVGLKLTTAGEDAQVVQRIGDALYHIKQMPREDIFGGKDYISAEEGHRNGPCSIGKNLTWSTKIGVLPQRQVKCVDTHDEKEEPLEIVKHNKIGTTKPCLKIQDSNLLAVTTGHHQQDTPPFKEPLQGCKSRSPATGLNRSTLRRIALMGLREVNRHAFW